MHQNMHQTLQTRKMQGIFKGRSTDNLFNLDGLFMVPGGGVEPPRAEARRILSPLRLPVPPSRLCTASAVLYNSLATSLQGFKSSGVTFAQKLY